MEKPYKAISEIAVSPLHEQTVKEKMEELKTASQPLIDYLYKYGSPYTTVSVTMDSIRVSDDTIGIPLEVRD